MRNSISNSAFTVTVKKCGAELCGLRSAAGREYIWQADPAIWDGHSPLLFPIVGKLVNDHYSFNGKTYPLGLHGFARKMDFELTDQGDDTLVYQLLPTAETRAVYPFDFALEVKYTLSGHSLDISFKVKNHGEGVMPFSMGGHPGFALDWQEKDCIEDYFIEFEREETAGVYVLNADHLLSTDSEPCLEKERILPLDRNVFDRDALIFLDLKSRKLALCSRKSDTRLILEFPDFPQLGIWAKPGAPYVCIEPWIGCDDTVHHNGDILTKLGIIRMEAGETFLASYRIVIDCA
jgi:galactose mutarotase-like enzyme